MTYNLPKITSTGLPTANPSISLSGSNAAAPEQQHEHAQTTPTLNPEHQQILSRYKSCIQSSASNTESSRNNTALNRVHKIITFDTHAKSSTQCSAANLAEACARGAFNPATNQQLLGSSRSLHVLPQPLLNKKTRQVDQSALANFHIKTMAQLLRRLSGIEYKLQLNTAKVKHNGAIALDLSFLKRASFFTPIRLIAGNLTTAFNTQLLRYMRRHVLFQMRNAALRAGEKPYATLKANLLDTYGDQTLNIRTIFSAQGFCPAQLEHNAANNDENAKRLASTPSLGYRIYQLLSLSFSKMQSALSHIKHLSQAVPNMKETGLYCRHTFSTQQRLDRIAPLYSKPISESVFQKMIHPHRFIYGLSAKSLERQLAESEFNQSGWQHWRQLATENRRKIAKAKDDQLRLSATLDGNGTDKTCDKLRGISKTLANLAHRQALYELRARRFASAYEQAAKRVLQSIAPTGFEQQHAERGFQHSGDLSAPNPYFAQFISSEIQYDRHRLMDETTQLVRLYDRTRRNHPPNQNGASSQGLRQINSLIKLNASVLKVRRQLPAEALEKVLRRLDTVFNEFRSLPTATNQISTGGNTQTHSDLSTRWRKLVTRRASAPNGESAQQGIVFSELLDDALKALTTLGPLPQPFNAQMMSERLRGLFTEFGFFDSAGYTLKSGPPIHQLWDYNQHQQEVIKVNKVDQLEKQKVFQQAYAPLNRAIGDYLKLAENDGSLLQSKIEQHIHNLMDNTVTGDELVSVYNTIVASAERILGDATGRYTHSGNTLKAYDATQALRQHLPEPIAPRYGPQRYLDSLKIQRAHDLSKRFIQLLDCLKTDIRQTSLPTPPTGRSGNYPLWQALQDRALMTTEKDQNIINTVFHDRSPHQAELQALVQHFKPEAHFKQQQVQALSQVYRDVINTLNQAGANIQFKANFGPGSFGNERSATYHGNRLYDAILASQPYLQPQDRQGENPLRAHNDSNQSDHTDASVPSITPHALATTLFQYMKQDLQHHFRRSDLDLTHLRDRFLWNRHSPVTHASAQTLSALIGDCDKQGNPRSINDPQARIAQLQQDYNRSVDMPAQVITQGVVNAAMLGSMFGVIPALIFNPILMFTPLPVSLLNFADWISMTAFGSIAAAPLTVVARKERKKNEKLLIEQASKQIEKIRANNNLAAQPAMSTWAEYPKIHYTRNQLIQPLINAHHKRLQKRITGIRQKKPVNNAQKHQPQEALYDHPNYYSQQGKGLNLSPIGQAGVIFRETMRWIAQDVLAGPMISFFKLPWTVSRLIYNDLLSPKLPKSQRLKQDKSNHEHWQKAWNTYTKQKDDHGVSKADYLQQFLVAAS